MTADPELSCYRCGASLASLTPPISRRDECPECAASLHVCLMCACYRKDVPRQCTEDDAEEVLEKARPNFCEWYRPSGSAFDPQRAAAVARAEHELDALFGGGDSGGEASPPASAAEDLFK